MIKEKKTHFEEKKALKNTFPQQKKHHNEKKSTKKHFCFLKTLAGRTASVTKNMTCQYSQRNEVM